MQTEVTKTRPEPIINPARWDVETATVFADGEQVQSTISISAAEVADPSDATVGAAAIAKIEGTLRPLSKMHGE